MLNRQAENPTKVAIYSRCSTKNQDIENQALELRSYCQRMGYTVYREYADYESGGTPKRAEFQQMFADARHRKFDVVLFWSLDRFSREGTRETINLLQQLESFGVAFRSYKEMYLDSTGIFRDALIALLACLGAQERLRLSDRVRAGLAKSRQMGRIGGRPRISQDKMAAIAELRSAGLSLRQIARELNIHHGTVREYLKN